MKRRKINILTAIVLGAVTTFTACSKDDGAIPDNIGIEDVPAVSINLESGAIAGTITFADQAAFQAKFKVSMYFANAIAPAKVDIVARKKNGTIGAVKVFKADVASLPANFTITAAELAALFGTPFVLKDTCEIGPDIYVGSKKYEAFPITGLGSGSGVTGMSAIGFGAQLTFIVK
jgi:hypothetical protein